MGVRGPLPKSAELRVREGEQAHRPLPAAIVRPISGLPERPKGLSSAAKRVWEAYVEQFGPLGFLRPIDGFALGRLCEDVALLQELQKGTRQLARDMKREAKEQNRKLPGGAMIDLTMSPEGRRLSATVNALAGRIKRDEIQFGLTPAASTRLESIAAMPIIPQHASMDPVEAALCG